MTLEAVLRRARGGVAVLAVALGIVAGLAAPAAAGGGATCSGTLDSPGTLAGTICGNVTVMGCAVDAGPAVVNGNLTIKPGSTLVAAFAGQGSGLAVKGNLDVQNGAALILGCDPQSFACIDDDQNNPTLSSAASVGGNLTASQALGVIVHNTKIGGNVEQHGGGGGFTCDTTPGVFALFQSPVFSTYEDSSIGGNLSITNVASCWLGTARVHIGGNASYVNNQLADPDAIEIVLNDIHGNLNCVGNTMVWDSGELSDALYPRVPQPNTVHGKRSGQCVLASPATEGGPSGPGSF